MTIVYGGCVEPGGMELDDDRFDEECPSCGGKGVSRFWQACEGGAINAYRNFVCESCNYREGDFLDDGFFDEEWPEADDRGEIAEEAPYTCMFCGGLPGSILPISVARRQPIAATRRTTVRPE